MIRKPKTNREPRTANCELRIANGHSRFAHIDRKRRFAVAASPRFDAEKRMI
ncbi:conserved hypothetical protein [Burkholderia mallei PRL-20]|nr:hypothetical protein BMASAVP1_A2150 [Burkholderia mallei SAVP1]EDK56896.1 hypothetical protein BMAFMH_C1202 [Burkholderia mallei FMH]EDK57150.1 hypothetical protein BMAJHU_A0052 [Burkholderia mallei JHU]EES44676.1 conserved hypothetical protein [Burkholderia mallei PRL-20]